MPREAEIASQSDFGNKPVLGGALISVNVNVRRLPWFMAIPIDSVRPVPQNCWHQSTSLFTPNDSRNLRRSRQCLRSAPSPRVAVKASGLRICYDSLGWYLDVLNLRGRRDRSELHTRSLHDSGTVALVNPVPYVAKMPLNPAL